MSQLLTAILFGRNTIIPCTKEKLDEALLSFERGSSICWNCIETHYPEEFAKRNGFFVYRRWCDACGTKQECTWTSIWRPLIFSGKEDIWLINRFEKEIKRIYARWLELDGSHSCFELVKRGNNILPVIFNYFDSNQDKINKEGWSYFF